MEPITLSAGMVSLASNAVRGVNDVLRARTTRTNRRPADTCVVTIEGDIRVVHADGHEGRHLSTVTQETFYGPDLNKIAATVRANQQANNRDPQSPSNQLWVDNHGDIYFGDQVGAAASSGRRLSKVTQETFYADWLYHRDYAEVAEKLPSDSQWATDGEIGGWLYSVVNEFGDTYQLFLWWEASSGTFKVSLVSPRLGGLVGIHDCHVFSDGTLCLKRDGGSGYPALADAYARSVLWTLGASYYRRGYGFQLNFDQVGS